MILTLECVQETLDFGSKLGQILVGIEPMPTVLLFGDLGAGKTTMVRGLVQGLPGAEQAEVNSPSFNLVNLYPTAPPVAHVDLYRLEFGRLGDDILDVLEDESCLTIVEWAERLGDAERPPHWLRLDWRVEGALRRVQIQANEKTAAAALANAFADPAPQL